MLPFHIVIRTRLACSCQVISFLRFFFIQRILKVRLQIQNYYEWSNQIVPVIPIPVQSHKYRGWPESDSFGPTGIIRVTSRGRQGVSNHRRLDCLINALFAQTTKKHQSSASLAICKDNPCGIHILVADDLDPFAARSPAAKLLNLQEKRVHVFMMKDLNYVLHINIEMAIIIYCMFLIKNRQGKGYDKKKTRNADSLIWWI